jgi:hypothetical protein
VFVKVFMDGCDLSNLKNLDLTYPQMSYFTREQGIGNSSTGTSSYEHMPLKGKRLKALYVNNMFIHTRVWARMGVMNQRQLDGSPLIDTRIEAKCGNKKALASGLKSR